MGPVRSQRLRSRSTRKEPERAFWLLFLAGLFLTAFPLLRPVATVGISYGDMALFAGAAGVAARGGLRRADAAVGVVAAAGLLLVAAVLLSTLLNPGSSILGAATLAAQYAAALILIPLALAAVDRDRRVTAAVVFVCGLAAMVVVGLAIVSFAPGVEADFIARGWMTTLGSGRNGLFAGVGELSKVAAMGLGLVYVLAVSGRIGLVRAASLVGVFSVALIVTRSASGIATAVAVLAVLLFLHLALRTRIREQYGSTNGLSALAVAVVGAGAGVWLLQFLDDRGADYQQAFVDRIARPLSSNGVDAVGSASVRGQLLDQGWASIGEHPLIGLGPEVFQQTSYYGAGVHVVPVMLWVELGMLGAIAWIVMVLGIAAVCVSRFHAMPTEAVGALAVIAAVIVTHAAAPYLYGRLLLVPLLLVLAMTTPRPGCARPFRPRSSTRTWPRYRSHRQDD